MARVQFRLDRRGIAEILKSPQMRDAINQVSAQVEANARAQAERGTQVDRTPYVTDRQAAGVAMFGGGMTAQERRATLIQAARSAGLEVRERNDE